MNSEQELALALQAQQGNREALGLLWDSITPKLFGYLVNAVGSKPLAEDLLQNTWLKAVEALPKYQHRGVRFTAWLFAIARNECKQYWRKTNREVPFEEDIHDRAVDDRKQQDSKLSVDQILKTLSANDQELLRLRYIADLSVIDIARVLHSNSVAVRVRLHRAMKRAQANSKL